MGHDVQGLDTVRSFCPFWCISTMHIGGYVFVWCTFPCIEEQEAMETPLTPSPRPGTPGLDVFKIAGRSISGFVHSFKTGDSRRVRQPFTTLLEQHLALFLEYH